MHPTRHAADGRPDRRLADGAPAARRFARGAAIAALAVCAVALAGWWLGIDELTRFVPGLPAIRWTTAIAFVLLSISVWRAAGDPSPIPLVGAPVAAALATTALVQNLGSGGPGQTMPTATSLAIVLLAFSAWQVNRRSTRAAAWFTWPAMAAMSLAYLAAVSFLVGSGDGGALGAVVGRLSLPSATVILLLGLALLSLHQGPWEAFGAAQAGERAGMRLARLGLPLALLLPAAEAWAIELMVRSGAVGRIEAHALGVGVLGVSFGMLVLGSAAWVSRLEGALRANEGALQRRVDERTAQLASAERQAEAARQRLAQIVQQADVAIVTVDPSRRIVLFNACAERMFGHRAADVLGQSLDMLVPPDVRARHILWVDDYERSGGPTRRMGVPLGPLHAVRADGQGLMLEASISSSVDDQGRMLTAVLRDISDALALQSEREARLAAEAANRAKSEQLGHVSHELRTPLNAVIGFSHLLRSDASLQLPDKQRGWITVIGRTGEHMLRLINDLVEISRIDARLEVLQPAPQDVQAALDAAAQVMAAAAAERGLTLQVHRSPQGLPPVLADGRRLTQILFNLLGNAIKYNRPGGRVDLRADLQADGMVALQVADTGIGMNQRQLERVFEPFDRVGREATEIEGSGLGLALARSMALAMSGRIDVSSVEGTGSTFTLILPPAPLQAVGPSGT